jgi:hypothetical protein
MTEQERRVVAACGEFCHVTTSDRVARTDAVGLDPAPLDGDQRVPHTRDEAG